MSKKDKKENGRCEAFAHEMEAIGRTGGKLEEMAQTKDCVQLLRVVAAMGRHYDRARELAQGKEDVSAVSSAYVQTLAKLHDAVFERERTSLHFLSRNQEICPPLTQRLDRRIAWDGVKISWESPAYERARGFARIRGRMPPMFQSDGSVNVERYAKFGLLAMVEATDDLAEMDARRACDSLSGFVNELTRCYEKFRTGACDVRPQIALVYLRGVSRAMDVCSKADTGYPAMMGLKGFISLNYSEMFWFRMPELPPNGNRESAAAFFAACESEIEEWMGRLCTASARLFFLWLREAVLCVESCIAYAVWEDASVEPRAAEVLARVIGRLRQRLDDTELVDTPIGRLTMSVGDSSDYTLSDTIDGLRRIGKNALRGRRGTVTQTLARRLRESTLSFCYALNFEFAQRWTLLIEYLTCLEALQVRINERVGGER